MPIRRDAGAPAPADAGATDVPAEMGVGGAETGGADAADDGGASEGPIEGGGERPDANGSDATDGRRDGPG